MFPVDLVRFAQSASALTKVARAVSGVQKGDPEALRYLLQDGIYEGLDAIRPGVGMMGREIIHHAGEILGTVAGGPDNAVLEGSYRVLPPWERLVDFLTHERYGAHVIAGPPGRGKTCLMFKLGYLWHTRLGWPVRVVNAYPDDLPPWAEP